LSINKSNIEIQKGNFSSWFYNKELQDGFEQAQNEKIKKELKRLDKSMKRTATWADKIESSKYGNGPVDRGYIGHKSAKMMKRAKSIETRQQLLINEKSELLKNTENTSDLKIHPLQHHSNHLISFENISVFYGKKRICKQISFNISNGDIVSLRGRNGSGKTSLLKLICGEDIRFEGDFHKVNNLIISYVPQDTSSLAGNLRCYAKSNNIDESLFKTILRKLDFGREQFDKDIQALSAGQKKKVLIARSLCEQAHIYIWDEPLNYIDVLSRIQIENLLLDSAITVLFVEHDQTFTDNIATQIIDLE
jgi:lincosamide and streptogramin A transport system ATP-binding/permease protein